MSGCKVIFYILILSRKYRNICAQRFCIKVNCLALLITHFSSHVLLHVIRHAVGIHPSESGTTNCCGGVLASLSDGPQGRDLLFSAFHIR